MEVQKSKIGTVFEDIDVSEEKTNPSMTKELSLLTVEEALLHFGLTFYTLLYTVQRLLKLSLELLKLISKLLMILILILLILLKKVIEVKVTFEGFCEAMKDNEVVIDIASKNG